MARPPSVQPTDVELEILNVLWEADGPAELGAIRAALEARRGRAVAATTVATMLKVMGAKGLVDRADGARGYVWSARLGRSAARSGMLGRLMSLAFDGSAHRLVAHLVEEGTLSDADRRAIRALLDEAPKPKGRGRRSS